MPIKGVARGGGERELRINNKGITCRPEELPAREQRKLKASIAEQKYEMAAVGSEIGFLWRRYFFDKYLSLSVECICVCKPRSSP